MDAEHVELIIRIAFFAAAGIFLVWYFKCWIDYLRIRPGHQMKQYRELIRREIKTSDESQKWCEDVGLFFRSYGHKLTLRHFKDVVKLEGLTPGTNEFNRAVDRGRQLLKNELDKLLHKPV